MYPSDTLFIKQNQFTTFTFSSILHRDTKQYHQETNSKCMYKHIIGRRLNISRFFSNSYLIRKRLIILMPLGKRYTVLIR